MVRKIKKIFRGKMTFDGAGVKLKRVFGHAEVPQFDPFLMLDEFGSDDPDEYMPGFPWHPHRGIETVTYLLKGKVEHGDSLGNSGVISDGQCQWMTAGGGIIHQEMPKGGDGLRGLQLWVNLPAKAKMSDPVYRGVDQSDIVLVEKPGITVKVIAGKYEGTVGPVTGITADPSYFDVRLEPGAVFETDTRENDTAFLYILDGDENYESGTAVLFDKGDRVTVKAGSKSLWFVYASGKPIGEEVAWGGPIVMNTREELDEAFRELDAGTFIKKKK
jgi:redox-sensitive bicupin YhaK (pirin superfamily)